MRCATPPLDLLLPEPGLPDDVRSLLERTLGGARAYDRRMTEPDPRALTRADFDAIRPVPTRWSDNDMFGHLNNAVYLELFDSVLNAWMQAETGIDENTAPTLGVVAETSCRYYREVSFPVTVEVGVRANRLGRTSVLFEFGVFLPDDEQIAAHGLWAQVYVDRVTRRPVPIPDAVRAHLEAAVARRPVPVEDGAV